MDHDETHARVLADWRERERAAQAANVQAMLARGFFNADAMREHQRTRRAALRGHTADAADLIGGAVDHDRSQPVTAMPGGIGLVPQPEGGFVSAAREGLVHGGDMAEQHRVGAVKHVLKCFNTAFDGRFHGFLLRLVGLRNGRGKAGAGKGESEPRQPWDNGRGA